MKRPALHIQILIALIVGACLGLAFNLGFSSGTSNLELPDAVIRIRPNLNVITLSLQELGPEDKLVTKTLFRDELDGLSDFQKTYPHIAEEIKAAWDADPETAQIEVTDRRIDIEENLDKITATYSRREAGAEESTIFTGKNVAEFHKNAPDWVFDVYETIGGTPSLTVASWAKAIGDLFLRLLKMITIPLIVTSLVTGVAGLGDTSRLGKLFTKTMLYYFTTSVLAITTGIIMVNLIQPGVGEQLPGNDHAIVGGADQSLTGVFGGLIQNMIPSNPIESLASANFLSIITFSILLGVFIIKAGEKGDGLRNLFASAFEVIMGMTMFVISLAPIGVCAFMVYATASQGIDIFMTLAKYMLTVFLALLVHAVIVLPLIVKFVARRSPWEFARAMSPALMTAFSTASSNGTLPLTLASVENRGGVPNRVSSFVLPLGATINMDGTALYEAVAVLFIAQATPGFDMSLQSQIIVAVTALMASVGAAGIPHAGLVMMAIILQAVDLPIEAQGVIIAVDRVLDMCRTSVNVWSDSCGCAVVARFDTPDNSSEAGG
ncbi:dicarboxylate/amino acid:cation symporter [Symmachiella dynata]|uniref:dicarboxylate/amino acid:cation symporter n=1 Tax=Symmachiella dynata TaxID=2527995 RepID=UPI0030EE6F8F